MSDFVHSTMLYLSLRSRGRDWWSLRSCWILPQHLRISVCGPLTLIINSCLKLWIFD